MRAIVLPIEALPAQEVWVGAGIATALLGAALMARRRGADLRHAFATAGILAMAALTGARILWAATAPDGPLWGPAPWSSLAVPDAGGFASFGGLFAAGAAALLLRGAMRETRWRARLDAVVPPGFVGLAVARLGCIPAGCDFGAPSGGPWAVRYPAETPAWREHVANQWIESSAAWSLPVHPFPFYLVVVTLLAVLAGSGTRRVGAHAVTTAGLYCAGRLVVEGVRSPSTDVQLLGGWAGLNQIWAVLGLVALGYGVWRARGSG